MEKRLSLLCAACGMCCDGTLFDLVKIQPEDSQKKLKSQGLRLKEKRGELFFSQPCSAYSCGGCTIYPDRPQRCRLFHCQQLQRVASGQIDDAQALFLIQETRKHIEEIHKQFLLLGSTNSKRSLATRYAAVCAQPLTEKSDPQEIAMRNKLHQNMIDLQELLKNEFLTQIV